MSEASNVARLLGTPSTFLFEEVEYKIASPTRQDIKADLQRYFERGVRDAIRRARVDLPKPSEPTFNTEAAEFEEFRRRQERLLAANYWAFGEEGYQSASTEGNGFVQQVYLCLKAHQPDITRETIGRMLRDTDTVLTILSIFSAYVKAENEQRTGAGAAGPKG